MTKSRRIAWDDELSLSVLDLYENHGLSAAAIAKAIRPMVGRHVSRNAVIGLIHRISCDLVATPDTAKRPQNRDGGMPPRWWEAGIRERGVAA